MKQLLLLLSVIVCFSGVIQAQKDTVHVDGFYETGGTVGTLNNAISDAQTAGTINNTVFKLTPYEVYVLSGSILVNEGEFLEITAPKPGDTQETAMPQIVWTEEDIDRAYIIQSYGDIKLSNIWIRYADLLGNQVGSSIQMENQLPENKPEKAEFYNVMFDYAPLGANSGGSVNVTSTNFVGIFKDSYFRNNTDVHFQYYGRALSFPFQSTGWGIDSVLFENTTFANMGYVYMQEGNQFGQNVHFNHCTFLNINMFALQSGWWNRVSVTNSVFVNPYMIGYKPSQVNDENGVAGGMIAGVTPVDSFGFEVDFTDLEREILVTHNSYVYEDWLIDWMESNPWSQEQIQQRESDNVPKPSPYINQNTLDFIDSTDAEGNKVFPKMVVDYDNMYIGENPNFVLPPTNLDTLKLWLMYKWDNNADINWAWNPNSGFNQEWPLPEDLSYTNETLLNAGMGGFPLGDLKWFPDEKDTWEAQRANEWDRILEWMATGTDPLATSIAEEPQGVPSGFKLEQNYPNPFNPSTQISYSVPKTSNITLKVYNALGQEVSTLYEGRKAEGNYQVTFNASSLPSGVYYYRLQTQDGSTSITRKLTLIK